MVILCNFVACFSHENCEKKQHDSSAEEDCNSFHLSCSTRIAKLKHFATKGAFFENLSCYSFKDQQNSWNINSENNAVHQFIFYLYNLGIIL